MVECPEFGSENTRPYEPAEGEIVIMCGDCYTTTTSLYGDIEVEKPDLGDSDAKPDEVQTTFDSIAARTDGGEQDG